MSSLTTPWLGLRHWGKVTLGETFPTGSMNQVRSVTVRGQRLVARLTNRSESDLQWEIDLLAFLARAGLRVPSLVPTSDGELRVGTLIVMEHVEGRCAENEDDYGLVAAYLSQLHDLTAGWRAQRPGWRACAELVTHERSGPVDVSALPPDVLARCRRAWARLAGMPQRVIHGDPNPSNVRITANQEVILLDWDEARVDASCLDLARPPMPQRLSGLDDDAFELARDAFRAWETGMFWDSVPDHARKQLDRMP